MNAQLCKHQRLYPAFILLLLPVLSAALSHILILILGENVIGAAGTYLCRVFFALGIQGEPYEIAWGWITIFVVLFGLPFGTLGVTTYILATWQKSAVILSGTRIAIIGRVLLIICLPLPIVISFVWASLWTLLILAESEFVPTYIEMGWSWQYCIVVLWRQLVMGVPYAALSILFAYLVRAMILRGVSQQA